ncbi:MAG: hypothetical protein Ta2B_24470 [Termitinemataceae bacterium]|nr:MAG: hypothetical protein Ta2B_24470 [Termitinemataceae bacterium]
MSIIAIVLGIMGTLPIIRCAVLVLGLMVPGLLAILGLIGSATAFFVGG